MRPPEFFLKVNLKNIYILYCLENPEGSTFIEHVTRQIVRHMTPLESDLDKSVYHKLGEEMRGTQGSVRTFELSKIVKN